MPIDPTKQCYCGEKKAFDNCCKPYHLGEPARTTEALMRSRFSAFATANVDYIIKTQASHLNKDMDPQDFANELQKQKWVNLEVTEVHETTVAFKAFMLNNDILYTLKERSEFEKVDDLWIYSKALFHEDDEHKMSRNESCPCGSGKKYKQCCQKG